MSLKAIKEKALEAWSSLPQSARKEIVSFIHTFVASFGFFVLNNAGSVEWTRDSILAFALSAVRAAVKVSWNKLRESRQRP